YVSILRINQDGSRLIIKEASGESGRDLKRQGHDLTVGQVSIVGWVAINRQARVALDVGEDPHYFNDPNLPDTHSEVALPLMARGRLLGVMDVHSREKNAFQEEDVSALQVLADQLANSLDNAALFEEINIQTNQLTELQTLTSLMNQQANTKNALNVLAEKAAPLFNADGGGVFLYQPEEKNLILSINLNTSVGGSGRTLKLGEGLAGRVFVENQTQSIEDYSTWEGRSETFVPDGLHAAVGIPLRRLNEPVGVLALTRSNTGQPFKTEEIQIAELLAAQVGAIITNNQLIEETRRLVQRERTINQASAEIRRSLDAKTILDTMTGQLGHLLGNRVVKARLFQQQEGTAEEQEQP
ncbi:MAG: GAF domain-containing protein, partial [Candidatus Promineifilaceae bacterium]